MSLKNPINVYVCDLCNQRIVTLDQDEGVTPMFIKCRATEQCSGTMVSMMYRVMEPKFIWRKPTPEEYLKLEPAMQAHVRSGGLVLPDMEEP